MATREERRAAVREAWAAADGKPDRKQLAAQYAVHVTTIARDIALIEQRLQLQANSEVQRLEGATFFEHVREMALARAESTMQRVTDAARAAYYRIALDAESKRAVLLGLNAPAQVQDVTEERRIVIRHEHADSHFADAVPVTARDYLAPRALQSGGDGTPERQDDARNVSN